MTRLACVILFCGIAISTSVNPARAQESQTKTESKETPEKSMVGWQWANFVVLAGILYWLARKHGTRYFAAQTGTIQGGIEDGRKRRAAAEKHTAEVQARLDNLDVEIEQLRKSLLADQAAQADRLRARTVEELDRIHANAEQQVDTLTKSARLDLQRHASKRALDLAGERLRMRLTPSGQHSLVEVFVDNLKS